MAFPSLSLPPLDDTMEVSSSPAGNALDNDIDIDFDDYYNNTGAVQLTDDEHMLEDGDPVRPPTATDEMMGDDEHVNAAPVNEEVMQDSDEAGQFDLADEELIDYDDDEELQYEPQAPVADTVFEAIQPTVQDAATVLSATGETQLQAVEPADEEIVRQPEAEVKPQEVLLEQTVAPGLEKTAQIETVATLPAEEAVQRPEEQEAPATNEQVGVDGPGADGDVKEEMQPVEDTSKILEAVEAADEADESEVAATVEEVEHSTETLSRKAPPQLPGSLDTTLRQGSEGPPTPTDTGLHPMTVRYGDHELPVFKSRSQPDGLLKNDNLANVSLSDLIKSCRERLPVKTGETVSDDQNLVLGFDSMGLVLVEGSPSASETSLQNVLDVYLLLHRNDGHDDIPPLSLTLTVQLKFTSHLEMFKQAAFGGQGMSSFAVPLPQEDEDYYDDEAEQQGSYEDTHDPEQTLVEDTNGDEENPTAEQDHAQDFTEEPDGEEHEQYEENNEYIEGEDYFGQHEGQEYHEDPNYEEYDEQAEYPDPEEDLEGTAEDGDLATETHTSNAQTHYVNDEADAAALDCTTDSAAVRAVQTNDVTGGYPNDDLISYDDDLTYDPSDTVAEDDGDELAALTDEHDFAAEDANFDEAYHDDGEANANDEPGLDLSAQDPYTANPAYPEPEEDGEQQYDQAREDPAHEEHTEEHADYVDNGDQGELPSQEEDDQFHTAFDLLDGEDQEHGPGDEAHLEAHGQPAAGDVETGDNNVVEDSQTEDASKDLSTEAAASNSPLGKRSFEELADDDLIDYGVEEPDTKKARSG